MPTSLTDVLYHGIAFDLKNWDKPIVPHHVAAAGEQLLDALDALGADYTLVGGLALLSYVDGRNTQDIDVIARVEDLREIAEFELQEVNEGFAQGTFRGLRVEILRREQPVFDLVASEFSERRSFGALTVKMASAEGLTLLKLFALPELYRQFRMDKVLIYEGDIGLLMRNQHLDTAKLLGILRRHLSESEIHELEKILREINEKLARGGKFGASPT